MTRLSLMTALFCTVAASVADANPYVAEAAVDTHEVRASYRSNASKGLIPGGGYLMSGQFRFITADGTGATDTMRFTDLVTFQPAFHYSIKGMVEVSAQLSLLSKQPSYMDEPVFQGGNLGTRVGLGDSWAWFASAGGGPLTGGLGEYGSAGSGLQWRKFVTGDVVAFEGTMGASATILSQRTVKEAPKFAEAFASGKVVARIPHGHFGGWFGVDFNMPVAVSSPEAMMPGAIDPQTRVNVRIGAVVPMPSDWDLFAEYVVGDRGDAAFAETTLPILEGGRDQQTLIVGVARRVRSSSGGRSMMYAE